MNAVQGDPKETRVGFWEVVGAPFVNLAAEDFIRHRGRYIARSLDGAKVLASGASLDEMYGVTHRIGLFPGQYFVDYIPHNAASDNWRHEPGPTRRPPA